MAVYTKINNQDISYINNKFEIDRISPNRPIFPPFAYGANKSTTLIPVTNISVSVD